jgi:hypothetical protein
MATVDKKATTHAASMGGAAKGSNPTKDAGPAKGQHKAVKPTGPRKAP